MKKYILIFILMFNTIVLFSQEDYQKLIIGYWAKVDELTPYGYSHKDFNEYPDGFYFESNIVEFLGNIYYSELIYPRSVKEKIKKNYKITKNNIENITKYHFEENKLIINRTDENIPVELEIINLN